MTVRIMIEKTVICILLLLAVYITITCKCEGILLSCKKYYFYVLVGLPLIYIFSSNTLK